MELFSWGKVDLNILKFLLKFYTEDKVNHIRHNDGSNVLMMFLPRLIDEEDLQIVELLCQAGVDLNF